MYNHVELFFGQKVRLKTKGDSPFLGEKAIVIVDVVDDIIIVYPIIIQLLIFLSACLLYTYIRGQTKGFNFVFKVYLLDHLQFLYIPQSH